MSPQILTLAKESGISFGGHPMNPLNVYPSQLEKFALLIVEECLNKIENEAAQYHEPVWAVELVNDIKEHFGMEP